MEDFSAVKEILSRVSRELDQVQGSIQRIDKRENDNNLLAIKERTELKGEIRGIQEKVSNILALMGENKKGVYWLGAAAVLGGALASGKIDKILDMIPKIK